MKELSSFSLPQTFQKKMSDLLGSELPEFLASYLKPRSNALRVNTLKVSPDNFADLNLFHLNPVPWCPEGFYYEYTDYPGKHPYHQAGVYYIQEPSAMAVAAYLDPLPGEYVLDLAAAPGGKSTQIASRLQGRGILWSNEIDRKRSRILLENLERWGTPNMIVSCESPDVLSRALPQFFDKILLDAPCSGEGMFRKDTEAIRHWNQEHVLSCALRQQKILASAASMLKDGGVLVYSTCTFSPEENEQCILNFLESHPDFVLYPLPKLHPDFLESTILPGTMRLYPHRISGEGHFIARLIRKTTSIVLDNKVIPDPVRQNKAKSPDRNRSKNKNFSNNNDFSTDYLPINKSEIFSDLQSLLNNRDADILPTDQSEPLSSNRSSLISHEGHFWLDPLGGKSLPKINILSRGLYLGQKKPGRFLPGYALAHTLKPEQSKEYVSLSPTDLSFEAYLHGEEISSPGPDGWALIGVDSFPLGWGRRSNGCLKNHYPKSLRQ